MKIGVDLTQHKSGKRLVPELSRDEEEDGLEALRPQTLSKLKVRGKTEDIKEIGCNIRG